MGLQELIGSNAWGTTMKSPPDWDRLGALMLNILHMEPEVFMYLQHMVGPMVEA